MLQDIDKTSECRLVFWTNFLKSLLSKNKLTLQSNELTLVQEVFLAFRYIFIISFSFKLRPLSYSVLLNRQGLGKRKKWTTEDPKYRSRDRQSLPTTPRPHPPSSEWVHFIKALIFSLCICSCRIRSQQNVNLPWLIKWKRNGVDFVLSPLF